MNGFKVKKAENCFSGSAVYQYSFSFMITEDFISGFRDHAEVKLNKNFPRPSYTVTFTDGTRIIGALKDIAFKTYFPQENPEKTKQSFEGLLSEILADYRPGGA